MVKPVNESGYNDYLDEYFNNLRSLTNEPENQEPEPQQEIAPTEEDSAKKEDIDKYFDFLPTIDDLNERNKTPEELEESWPEFLTRNAVSNASRVAEKYIGRTGDLEDFAKNAVAEFPQAGGIFSWGISQLMSPEKWRELVLGHPALNEGKGFQFYPTSEQLKDISQKATGGYTAPKTEREKALNEFSEDVGTMVNRQRGLADWRNFLAIPALSNSTKQIAKEAGFSDDTANILKIATWIPLSLANNISAQQYAGNLMNQGRNGVPANAQINAGRLYRTLFDLEDSFLSSDPRSAIAKSQAVKIMSDLRSGKTSLRQLMETYDGINALKRSKDFFDLSSDQRTYARLQLDKVKNVIRDEILSQRSRYPEAINSWQNGVAAFATIHQSNKAAEFLEDIARGPYAKLLIGPAAAAFGGGLFASYTAPITTAASATLGGTAYKTTQIISRIMNNQNLRRYYFNAYNELLRNNTQAFLTNYKRLNEELKKEEKKEFKSSMKSMI